MSTRSSSGHGVVSHISDSKYPAARSRHLPRFIAYAYDPSEDSRPYGDDNFVSEKRVLSGAKLRKQSTLSEYTFGSNVYC